MMKLMEFKAVYPQNASVARFVKGYAKWNNNKDTEFDFLSVPFDESFCRELNNYFLGIGHNNFTHHKNALKMYFKWGGEDCRDKDEKLEYLGSVKKSVLFPSEKTAIASAEDKEIPLNDRAYVASPKHLLDLIKTVYGDEPDTMCIALMLLWDGISIKDACGILKSQVNESCDKITFGEYTVNISEEFVPYLQWYRHENVSYSPLIMDSTVRVKSSEYFLERTVKNDVIKPPKRSLLPVMQNNIYKKMGLFNELLAARTENDAYYTIPHIGTSGRCWRIYQAQKNTNGKYSAEYLIKLNFDGEVNGVGKALRDYGEWLAYVLKECQEYINA